MPSSRATLRLEPFSDFARRFNGDLRFESVTIFFTCFSVRCGFGFCFFFAGERATTFFFAFVAAALRTAATGLRPAPRDVDLAAI